MTFPLYMKKLSCMRLMGAVFIFINIFSASKFIYAEEDGQAWISADINIFKTERSKFYFYLETRSNEQGKKLQQYYYGPRYTYKISDRWLFGSAFKSINIRDNDGFNKRYRIEIDMTYNDSVGEKGAFDFRNRLEQFYEDGDYFMKRYRARLRYKYHLNNSYIKKIFASQELIYDDNDGWQLQQSRFIPVGLSFSLGGKTSMNIFYMHRTRHRPDREDDISHVLGAMLNF